MNWSESKRKGSLSMDQTLRKVICWLDGRDSPWFWSRTSFLSFTTYSPLSSKWATNHWPRWEKTPNSDHRTTKKRTWPSRSSTSFYLNTLSKWALTLSKSTRQSFWSLKKSKTWTPKQSPWESSHPLSVLPKTNRDLTMSLTQSRTSVIYGTFLSKKMIPVTSQNSVTACRKSWKMLAPFSLLKKWILS